MDQNLIEKYKNEMLKMYRSQRVVPAVAEITPPQATAPAPQITPANPTVPPASTGQPAESAPPATQDSNGKLVAIVTTLRSLYPLQGARVTVFTGDYQNPQVITTALTDQSGRTEEIVLPTPLKELSLESGSVTLPYAIYNMTVEADGYRDNVHLNIPIFSGVTSLQTSNMMLNETAGTDNGPQIFDESQQFNL